RDQTVKLWNLKGAEPSSVVATNLYSGEWGNFTFSPDSKLMAAGCKDDNVRVWRTETLELKRELEGAKFAVAFSRDSASLLTARHEETSQWWNIESKTAKPIPAYKGGKLKGVVECVDFSEDRRIAALGFNSGKIQLLEVDSGRELGTFLAHTGGVGSVAF